MKSKPFFRRIMVLMALLGIFYLLGVAVAQESITSVDGGASSLSQIIERYKGFAPLLIGLVFIGLRRKFFPSSHDKK